MLPSAVVGPREERRLFDVSEAIEEAFNAFTTYLHFVKDEDFDVMYADLKMALLDTQIDPMQFRAKILKYIEKIVSEAPESATNNGFFFNRYRRKLQRTADALQKEFGLPGKIL